MCGQPLSQLMTAGPVAGVEAVEREGSGSARAATVSA